MNRFVLALWLIFFSVMASGCAAAESTVAVQEVWARPGIAGGNSAIYFSVKNESQENDTLLEARTQAAAHVELHQTTMSENGSMSMQQQASVPIPAGTQVDFMPGGLHVMLIELQDNLQVGQTFDLELHFERSGTIRMTVEVKEQGG